MIQRVNHVQISIPVGSEKSAKEFYCLFLGLNEIEKPENLKSRGGFWLQIGNLQVHFGTEDGVDRRATKAHIAYEVQNLSHWRNKLQEKGIEILDGISIPGCGRFEFRDPFGNRVEFIERSSTIELPKINLKAIGIVHSSRGEATDDFWGDGVSSIELDAQKFKPDALQGLTDFSHIEVVYFFHKVLEESIVSSAGHPRENNNWPKVGIFSQRKKNRPNCLGVSVCRLLKVELLTLTVQALDAIDGTPVLDIKPYIKEFVPLQDEVRQPDWASELMKDYWKKSGECVNGK